MPEVMFLIEGAAETQTLKKCSERRTKMNRFQDRNEAIGIQPPFCSIQKSVGVTLGVFFVAVKITPASTTKPHYFSQK